MFKIAALALLATAGAAQAVNPVVTASIGAPGAQTTAKTITAGVETFDGLSGDQGSYATTFGGSPYAATIENFRVDDANMYGGAGGSGKFVTNGGTMTLTFTGGPAVNYFGLWVSALDAANSISFYNGANLIGSWNLTDTLNGLSDAASYKCNPNANYAGQNCNESYAFIDFTSDSAFTKIELTQGGGGGFELDNLTVGSTAAVPEPATWGMMLLGFGLVGAAARRRRAARTLAVAA